jgi:MYXO-CTERM domain-containing protein
MRRALATQILCVLVVGLSAAPAAADAIPPANKTCFPGTRASSSHSGVHCDAIECDASRPCKKGKCQARQLCVHKIHYTARNGDKGSFEVVAGECPKGRSCVKGQCKTLKVCVSGCGCAIADPGAPELLSLALLGLLLALRRRRRGPACDRAA